MTSWIAIVNPNAGTYRSAGFGSRWLPRLRGLVDEVVFTTRPGDGTRLAESAAGYGGIVAVGGDGSISDIVAGMDRDRQQLSVVPTGRGNTLARELGVGRIRNAIDTIRGGRNRRLDLMHVRLCLGGDVVHECMGITTIGIGYTATVVQRAGRLRPLGRLAYALSALLTRPCRFRTEVTVDGGFGAEHVLTGLIVNNTRFLANFLALLAASPSDGRLDLMLLRTSWAAQILHNVSVLSGLNLYQPAELRQASETRLTFGAPQTVMIDGELIDGVASMRVVAVPGAVTVRCAGPG